MPADERTGGAGSSGVILLVEDNPDDQILTEHALRANRISNPVVVARNGVEALKYIYEQGPDGKPLRDPPRMILLDLKLPKVDGLHVLDRVRRDPAMSRIPIIVLTSSDEERDYARSQDLGATCFVQKPVNFDAFLAMVREMWPHWLNG